ncbi:hypothetical protein LC613_39670 [Nostoc sphaeroides CHAB 2801]|uniref:hypothetical protein n=1 Tax=Nostoc sphaeroides TaxID=446679 RepID=UPI001E61DEB8|nr:hypothetical protein [Nostoc sphaeroides]MCC5633571.1 hypothetical protein [Nostoc sphaeroides CHAB 2801]
MDSTQSESASLLAENQDCDVEAVVSHEGACSAAPVSQNEFSSKKAIANQIQGQVEQGQSAFLPGENQVSDVEMKADHKGTGSGASPAQIEKSSTSAIANQTQEEAEASNPASLLVENSVSGVEIKAVHEGTCSAAPVAQNEFSRTYALYKITILCTNVNTLFQAFVYHP